MAQEDLGLVRLVDVDEARLDELVRVATTTASADEVTPPLTSADVWTEERVAWLRRFHRDRRAGVGGPEREVTWAILEGDQVVGSVRLKRTENPDVLEAGIWLSRSVRGRGIGRAALAEVVRQGAELGADAVLAETTPANLGALSVLRRLGFHLSPIEDGRIVRAVLVVGSQTSSRPFL